MATFNTTVTWTVDPPTGELAYTGYAPLVQSDAGITLDSYVLERDATIEDDNNTVYDIMDDGTTKVRVLGYTTYTMIPAVVRYLTQGEMQALTSYIKDNVGQEITWSIDGKDYTGYVIGKVSRTMVGNLYNVRFTYRAKEVA